MDAAINILRKYWGYKSFRPLQEEIITSVFNGHDTLALLPTGGGKSICFQVPAMMSEGLCLVITPLISLMKDQVQRLNRLGMKAVAIYSGMNAYEIAVAMDNAMFGEIKFLYVSPERLETELFKTNLPRMNINLLVVDEAHCISQWGYDFRPSYLKIAHIRPVLTGIPVLALTATATKEVVGDIQQKLQFERENAFQLSFERKNLVYVVQHEENKPERLLKVAGRISGTGIIYVRNRRRTAEIAEFLNKNNISSHFYHAGLSLKDREVKQDDWMKGLVRVMVATNAFGMGIDKPNVRFVVHYDLPDCIESYFQEAGRAGRDGLNSYAVLLYEEADLQDLKNNVEKAFPPIKKIKEVYNLLGNYFQLAIGSGQDVSFEFNFSDFVTHYQLEQKTVTAAMGFLEREGYLTTHHVLDADSKIHFIVNKENLYKFQVEHVRMDSFVKLLLRSYSGLFTDYVRINEKLLANRLKVSADTVQKMLRFLQDHQILSYIERRESPGIVFTKERLSMSDLLISPENYQQRKKVLTDKSDAMVSYVKDDKRCRSISLLAYFNETQANRCGYCDVCIQRNKLALSKFDFDQIIEIIKPVLKKDHLTIKSLADRFAGINEDKLIKVVQWLLDNDKVYYDDEHRISWKN